MCLFSFRMKNGNCVIVYAKDELTAVQVLNEMGVQSTVASVRPLSRFVASFALTDSGDLQTTLLDAATLTELAPDYPLLQAARAHSYIDFEGSNRNSPSAPVLFHDSSRRDANNWDQRDQDVVAYAVRQERERFSN